LGKTLGLGCTWTVVQAALDSKLAMSQRSLPTYMLAAVHSSICK